MYLDYAEDQAKRKKTMHMADWIAKLDAFLQFNERNILSHAGKVSQQLAEQHAHQQFSSYDAERLRLEAEKSTSDFDQFVQGAELLKITSPTQGLKNDKKQP